MTYSDFLEKISPLQSSMIAYLNGLMLTEEGTSRKIRFKVPFYDYNSWFCYLNPVGKDKIELCFLKGQKMKESFSILQLRGRKMVSGLILDVNMDIPKDLIVDMIKEAIHLNMR